MISHLSMDHRRERKHSLKLREIDGKERQRVKVTEKATKPSGSKKVLASHMSMMYSHAYNITNIHSCVFKKHASDPSEVAVKRRQKNAQAKATKRQSDKLFLRKEAEARELGTRPKIAAQALTSCTVTIFMVTRCHSTSNPLDTNNQWLCASQGKGNVHDCPG